MNIPFKTVKDWILVAPFGDHQHQFGVQRIDEQAVSQMANRFNGFIGRLGRFFNGVQVFEGHPDTDPEKYPSTRSFGLVKELKVQNDGLWARVEWTPEGQSMLQNGAYQFVSPVWNAREIARTNGRAIYRPETLESLGLTNLPNLPLPPLANTQPQMKKLTELLNLTDEATADEICARVETLSNSESQLRTQDSELRTELATLQNQLSTQSSELSTAQSQLAIERAARIDLLLANAIEKGRIPKADEPHWRAELTKDINAALTALANTKPALPTESQTQNLGNARAAYDNEATRRTALAAYIADQESKGLTYDEAWAKAKTDRADIFSAMSRN